MSKVQSIKKAIAPKISLADHMAARAAAKKATAPMKQVSAEAADAMASQNKAMVNMQQKKPYVKPEVEVHKFETKSSILASSSPDRGDYGGGRGSRVRGMVDIDEESWSRPSSSGVWGEEW